MKLYCGFSMIVLLLASVNCSDLLQIKGVHRDKDSFVVRMQGWREIQCTWMKGTDNELIPILPGDDKYIVNQENIPNGFESERICSIRNKDVDWDEIVLQVNYRYNVVIKLFALTRLVVGEHMQEYFTLTDSGIGHIGVYRQLKTHIAYSYSRQFVRDGGHHLLWFYKDQDPVTMEKFELSGSDAERLNDGYNGIDMDYNYVITDNQVLYTVDFVHQPEVSKPMSGVLTYKIGAPFINVEISVLMTGGQHSTLALRKFSSCDSTDVSDIDTLDYAIASDTTCMKFLVTGVAGYDTQYVYTLLKPDGVVVDMYKMPSGVMNSQILYAGQNDAFYEGLYMIMARMEGSGTQFDFYITHSV